MILVATGVGLAVAVAIAAPHRLPLSRLSPGSAAAVWLLALALRALTVVGAVVFLLVSLPQSVFFEAVARWCLHELWPLLVTALGLSGHSLADAAVFLPALALAASILWLGFGAARAALALRRYLHVRQCGRGPQGTTLVADREVLVALAGFGPPRVLVSDGALGALDSEELEASLAHERGHVRGRHRPVLYAGALMRAIARPLPGTAAAERGLALQLEREADAYAVAETHDPMALASAICKAAGSRRLAGVSALGGKGGVALRLECLLEDRRPLGGDLLERTLRVVAALFVTMELGAALALPAWAAASKAQPSAGHAALLCRH